MEISYIIIFLGLLIFSSHIFNSLFNLTKIPNVLLLLLIGIIVGPISGLIDKSFFGGFGSVFTTITLIVIMFESGTNLKFRDIKKAIGSATLITIINFTVTIVVATFITHLLFGINLLGSIFIGAIIGGTSSAVVIPMIQQLNLSTKSQTILFLESALSDVLCLVVGLAVLEGMKLGAIDIGDVFSKMWKAFLFAMLLGLVGGFVWSVFLKFVRSVKNSMITSLAFVFVLYGIVEALGFNGGIATLSFGIILGNSESLNENKFFKKVFAFKAASLNENEKNFFGEIVFILQTYFFVYIGISIQFGNISTYIIGLLIVVIIILLRPFAIRLLSIKGTTVKDIGISSVMTPKGLVTAVLASLPLQYGIAQGEKIQDLGYAIVLLSIVICSILVIVISKDPLIFTKYFKGTKFDENAEQNLVQVNPETKVEELPVEDISNNETITKTENNNKV
jgi:NhaP-type Na+/H+ or K+/H+ antiporter